MNIVNKKPIIAHLPITYSDSEHNMYIFIKLLKDSVEKRNGIKLYKNTILNIINIFEFVNNKYDPIGIKLDGWTEHMNSEIDNYDDILEELYIKTYIKIIPEIKIVGLIFVSATTFHFSRIL